MHLETKVCLPDGKVIGWYYGLRCELNQQLPTVAVAYRSKQGKDINGKDYYDIRFYLSRKNAEKALAKDAKAQSPAFKDWDAGVIAEVTYKLIKDKEGK